MINFDTLDFSECSSEEVISFFWRSVFVYFGEVFFFIWLFFALSLVFLLSNEFLTLKYKYEPKYKNKKKMKLSRNTWNLPF